jgi:HSP20 family protein
MAGPLILRHRGALLPDLLDWLEGGIPALPILRGLGGDTHPVPVELQEGEGAYIVRAELPGLEPERDIEVTASGDILVIRAQHTDTTEGKHQSEFRYGAFQRVVRLPFVIPEEGIEAGYSNGILTLTVPRPAEHKEDVRTIPVTRTTA